MELAQSVKHLTLKFEDMSLDPHDPWQKAGMVHTPNSGEMQGQRQDAPVPGLVVVKFQWETYVNQKVEDT